MVAEDDWAGPVRVVDPPVRVVIDATSMLRSTRVTTGDTALRVSAYGLYPAPSGGYLGVLHAWYQLSSADWYGLVTVELRSSNGRTRLTVTQLWPAWAIRRPGEQFPQKPPPRVGLPSAGRVRRERR